MSCKHSLEMCPTTKCRYPEVMEEKTLKTLDINLKEAKSDGVAYYRLEPKFRDFIELCFKERSVIGFEYDGSLNFGIILGEKKPSKENENGREQT